MRKLWTVFQVAGREVVVHKDLDLIIERGEMLSLVGGSGSGKTTILRTILGLEVPARGTVTVLGRPAERLSDHGAASRVGMLFQHGALFSAFSVLDNIAFPLRELRTLPEDLVRDAALVKLQMVGLDTVTAHKMPSDLSGGMIKRVALARALIMDPPLLLLDEPTAGLDAHVEEGFFRLLEELNRRLTIVMVSHDLGFVAGVVKSVICVGQKVVVHPTSAITGQVIADLYGADMRMIRHDHRCSEEGHQC
jgi:phospholipid/cholesterol/gamma-HCH transport system ATP-binding protein